ncbi:MAG TPA: FIST N-terminal domain-containing protein [Solirubrobacteraceae bacterium]
MSIQIEPARHARLGGFGHSTAADAMTAGRDAVRGALAGRLPARGDLVLVFPSPGYDLEELHRAAMEEAGSASVVGATTAGAFTDEAQVPFGCVAAYLGAEGGMSFGACHVRCDDADVAGSTRRAAEVARQRAGEEHEHSVLMVLCDGRATDQREMARGAYEVVGGAVPLVGGAAGDELGGQATYTFGEGAILAGGLVAVWINSARPMAVSIEHGWRPFGKPMLVTRAEGDTIVELDGRPALEAYVSERGAALGEDARAFAQKCMERPLGLPNAHGRYDVRHVQERAPGGGIVLPAGVPEHTVVQVMAGDAELLLEGARRAADTASAQLEEHARLALIFSSRTRAPLLGERLAEEVAVISSRLGGVAAGGFRTCGEFARVAGSTGIHNSSVALLVL